MIPLLATPLLQTFAAACTKTPLFGIFIPWYQYLTLKTQEVTNTSGVSICAITNFDDSSKILGSSSPVFLIALAIIDDLIRLAALIAAGYIVYGGIQFITSQGSPDGTNKARQTIINALVGLVLAIVAASLVAWIGGSLGTSSTGSTP